MKGTPKPLLTLDETDHIRRAQQGDSEAFSPLVVKYHDRLLRHITRRVKDPNLAKDLTQETWLRAYRAIQSYRCESSFYSWLYRIAENVIIDHFRKQKPDTVPLHLCDENHITETHTCPSQAILRQELRETLKTALNCLTTLRREVFVLYYHQELPIKAIAARLNRSEGTIKSHLRNARLQIQEVLTPYLTEMDSPQSV